MKKLFMPCIALLLLIHLFAFTQPVDQASTAYSVTTGFVENKGQITDQFYRPNTAVRYIYASGSFNLQLRNDGFSYELFQYMGKECNVTNATCPEYDIDRKTGCSKKGIYVISNRIDITFLNAANAELSASLQDSALLHFYTAGTGVSGVTHVRSFRTITYKNVYPGIDLVFSAPDNQHAFLKYEWHLQPGADPTVIRLQYDGVPEMNLLADGSVGIKAVNGMINEGRISAYAADDLSPVDVRYTISKNKIGYKSTGLHGRAVVIDPNITWFTYYGGNAAEDLYEGELSVDLKGNACLAGNTMSTLYIASTGAHQVIFGGGVVDGFAAKFKPSGLLAWATYYGSNDRDGCHAIAADDWQNVFVGGNTFSNNGIATAGSHQPLFGGAMDAFLVKFDINGIRQWATYFGGTGYGDQISAIVCDAAGNIYFDGYTCSANNIATAGAYQEIYNGNQTEGDVMAGAFTNNGTLRWCSYLSGPGQDRAHDIALLSNGDFYIQGTCESTSQFATPGVHQSVYGGGPQDAFIAKWDTTGHLYWCSYFGGEEDEHGRGLQTDADGNAYIGGWTISQTGIGTPGTADPEWNEGYNNDGYPSADGYLAKFTPDGQLAWGTYYGGPSLDRARGIAIDKENNFIYLAGQTGSDEDVNGNIFMADEGLFLQDGFVAKYTAEGALAWNYIVGAGGEQNVFDIEWDKKSKSLYMAVVTDTAFFNSSGVYQSGTNGGDEVQLIKLNVSDACKDKYEPNDSYLTAAKINVTADLGFYGYTGAIASSTDQDWFQFKTVITTNLKFDLSDLLADYDLFLYKKNGQLINSSANTGTTDESIILNNASKGTYLLKVASANASSEPNACYRINAFSNILPWFARAANEGIICGEGDLQIALHPNPASDHVLLKITGAAPQKLKVNLLTPLHQVIWSEEWIADRESTDFSIDLSGFAQGLYLFELQAIGNWYLAKLLVQR
ncbi:MAG: SBBP repeat-containing protein [Chitinophagales bacterium]|nr:SBBP repeat-containing protein [Chitinophagales bacterium]